jgi:hypothetical protein
VIEEARAHTHEDMRVDDFLMLQPLFRASYKRGLAELKKRQAARGWTERKIRPGGQTIAGWKNWTKRAVVQWWRTLCAGKKSEGGKKSQPTAAGAPGAGAGLKGKAKSNGKGGRGVDRVPRPHGRVRRGEKPKKKGPGEGGAVRPLLSGRRQTIMDQYFKPTGGKGTAHDTGIG